jgi:hypothetical protein
MDMKKITNGNLVRLLSGEMAIVTNPESSLFGGFWVTTSSKPEPFWVEKVFGVRILDVIKLFSDTYPNFSISYADFSNCKFQLLNFGQNISFYNLESLTTSLQPFSSIYLQWDSTRETGKEGNETIRYWHELQNIFKEKKWGNLKTFVTGQFQID